MDYRILKTAGSLLAAGLLSAATATGAIAQKTYDVGASDTEIKIGNIMPYSGPASAYSVIGKTFSAYFKMVNEQGGINGRKINLISSIRMTTSAATIRLGRVMCWATNTLLP